MTEATSYRSTNSSKNKSSVKELIHALKNGEKLDCLPDVIQTGVFYRLALCSNTQDGYKLDPFLWKNTGTIPYPKNNPEFIKIYYSCINAEKKKDGRCVKHVYISKTNVLDVLVHYHGNLDIATKHSHGNSQLINSHVHRNVPSSVVNEIDGLVTTMSGAAAYKTLSATIDKDGSPRNEYQCKYRRRKYLESQRISTDEILNIGLLGYELNGFFKFMLWQPQLVIVLMHDQMKKQFSSLLKLTEEIIPLYYDTTFSLGEVYVSILSFRHTMFTERPILPIAILMHDTKQEYAHDNIARVLEMELPDLYKKCVFITDHEIGFKNAFRKCYPTMPQLRCWNHALKDIKIAAKKYLHVEQQSQTTEQQQTPSDEQQTSNEDTQMKIEQQDDNLLTKKQLVACVMEEIKDLLRSTTRDEFINEYANVSQSWSPEFYHYFETYCLPSIDELGAWSSLPMNLFDDMSGVTSNPSESINAVFKRWLCWKELSLDALVQMFYLVLGYYVNEIRRGFSGYGNYHLQLKYNDSKVDPALLTFVSGFSPDVAVEKMRSLLLKRKSSENHGDSGMNSIITKLDFSSLNNDGDISILQDSAMNPALQDTSIQGPTEDNDKSSYRATLSNTDRAELHIQQGLVKFHEDSGAFIVRSLDHNLVHAVHMSDPKRLFRCSCSNTTQSCFHILCVKVYLKMPMDKSNEKVNLGHSRKRRRIEDKITKPGGKRPRRCDKDPEKKNTSPYFHSNENSSTILSQTKQIGIASQTASLNNPSSITRALTDISNVPSSSTALDSIQRRITSIRFVTPINISMPLRQSTESLVLKPL
ncbi:unnamed protein product [Adineta steineri]|uniref:SWIM-type domain-containing protein n=1 Tax=Adineta steineri TaxID=433720 RepID=A0A813Z9S6_9BILA|nr:unnamed protein product [Adineta steineri]CAF0932948.1 unnamed protein product [Adineta steineri]CAF1274455.1 unnamed protein product [Adineta steineri]CAF4113371.1 unnamed protein product [Adineta steineri]